MWATNGRGPAVARDYIWRGRRASAFLVPDTGGSICVRWARSFFVARGTVRTGELPAPVVGRGVALGRTVGVCARGSAEAAATGVCDAAASEAGGADDAGSAAGPALAAGGAGGAGDIDTRVLPDGDEPGSPHLCTLSTAKATRKLSRAAIAKIATRETQASRGTRGKSSAPSDM